MKSQLLLFVTFLLASGSALSMSECQADCERAYKACATSGKMSERACFAELEKCRKKCLKADPSATTP